MATVRRARRTRRQARDHRAARVEMGYVDINDIAPYEFNPRDNSAAIESVANSIRTFGFLVPVVIDAENVLVAGHTRVEAAKILGIPEVPAIRAEHLTAEQIKAFRIIDNKVSELAKWDFDLLSQELTALKDSGLDFTDYGYSREELDCLTDMVADDCLSADGLVTAESRERLQRAERRAPGTARFVLGEVVFFIPATEYRRWVDGLRSLHDFNEENIVTDLKRRLGLLEREAN
jgi:ParB-like nuclease domain